MVSLEEALLHHVEHSAWSTDYYVNSLLENSDFISDNSASDASVYLDSDKLSYLLNDVSDLLGQFSGGCHDQSLSVE